ACGSAAAGGSAMTGAAILGALGASAGRTVTGAGGGASLFVALVAAGARPTSATGAASIGSAGSAGSGSGSATGAATGLTVFTRRGGGSAGAAGLTGSAAFFAGVPFLPLAAGVSANMLLPGSEMLRCRATRSTNWRATTSSIVLEALLTSMPWSRLRSAVTSWLVVPRSSAILKIRTVAKRLLLLRVFRRRFSARGGENLLCLLLADARNLRQLLRGRGGKRLERGETAVDELAHGLLADARQRV